MLYYTQSVDTITLLAKEMILKIIKDYRTGTAEARSELRLWLTTDRAALIVWGKALGKSPEQIAQYLTERFTKIDTKQPV